MKLPHNSKPSMEVKKEDRDKEDEDSSDIPNTSPIYASGLRLWAILCSIFLATLTAALDLGVVATAIPDITADFNRLDDIGWYGGTIFITVGASAPVVGKMYKYFSGRWVYLGSVVVFLIGSLIAAPAPTSAGLIVGRAFQGVGVAGILGGSVLMITYIAEPKQRPMLIGVWTGVLMISTVLGPLLGGVFTTYLNWRWIFWINLPIGVPIIALILLFFHVPNHIRPTPATWREILRQLDLPGCALFLASLTVYTQALQWGGQSRTWSDGAVIALLVVWLVLTVGFVAWERSQGHYAMIPLANLKPRLFWTNALYGWLVNLADFQVLFYLPIYFQSIHGQSAIISGVNTIPFVALFAVGSVVSGIVASKTGLLQPLQLASGVLSTAGAALLYTLGVDSGAARYIGPQLLLGFGIGLGNQIPMTAYQFFSAPTEVQTNTGIMLMTNGMSGAYFVTAATTIWANRMLQQVAILAPEIPADLVLETGASDVANVWAGNDLSAVRESYMTGIKAVFAFSIAGAASTVLVALIIPKKRLPGHTAVREEADVMDKDGTKL